MYFQIPESQKKKRKLFPKKDTDHVSVGLEIRDIRNNKFKLTRLVLKLQVGTGFGRCGGDVPAVGAGGGGNCRWEVAL